MAQDRPVPTERLRTLRKQLSDSFSTEELRSLAADPGIDHESFPDKGKDVLVRELVQRANQTLQLPKLLDQLEQLRPAVTWALDDPAEAAEPESDNENSIIHI